MPRHIFSGILCIPTIILTVLYLYREWHEDFNKTLSSAALLIPFGLLFSLAPFGIRYVWDHSEWLAFAYAAICYGSFVPMVCDLKTSFRHNWPPIISLVLCSISIITLFISIPVTILPTIIKYNSQPKPPERIVDTSEIENSVALMKKKLLAFDKSISTEKDRLLFSLEELTALINEQDADLRRLDEQTTEMRKELEIYRNLVSITEDQAKAIRQKITIQKNRMEYIIAFILGFASSALVTIISWLISKNQRQKKYKG